MFSLTLTRPAFVQAALRLSFTPVNNISPTADLLIIRLLAVSNYAPGPPLSLFLNLGLC